MNTPNPLVPQGTTPARGKSTFFFKVLMILTVHVVLIGGMLLQGCKDTNTSANPPAQDTTAATPDQTLPPVTAAGVSNAATNPQQPAPQPTQVTQAPQPPAQPMPPATVTAAAPPAPSTELKEYVIVSGDTLGAIAHKNGITLKAIMDANPGINPKKLKVGQKVQIPAGTGSVASAASLGAAAGDMAAASGDTTIYTVKSGDTLSKIAKSNHTSFKKIMALNDLKTTSIKVGQKLKVPAKAAATETPAPATAVAPLQPAAASTTTAAAGPATAAN
jgi:LysM repeat protein